MRSLVYQSLIAADIASNQNGPAIDSKWMISVSAQGVVTGSSPNGTFKLQGSNDESAPTNWSDIGSAVTVNATGTWIIPAMDVCYSFIRVVWVKNSGSGAITAILKTVGY